MMLRIGELQLDRTPSHQIANLMQAAVVHVLSSGSFPAFGTGTVAGIAVFSDDLRWWQILVPQNDSLGFILAGTQFGRCFRDRCACFHPVSLLHVPFLQHDLVGRHATVSKIPVFLERIATLDKWYLAEVPSDTRVWLRTPPVEPPGSGSFGRPRIYPRVKPSAARPLELRILAAQLPRAAWHRRKIKEGSKGPIVVELAFVRVTPVRDQLPGPRNWAIFRRSLGSQSETKYYLSNAPKDCPQLELIRVVGMRWPVETALEEGKGETGLDHFETRTWQGWHHHMLQSFLAHLFLIRLRLLFEKKAPPSPHPKLINWSPRSLITNSNMRLIFPRSSAITNVGITPLTALTSNGPALDWKKAPPSIVRPKSRCKNRNLVVR